MIIREEEPKDYDAVYSLVKTAFESAEHSDGNEHKLVSALRHSKSFIPELSIVAEIDGIITGYILFTRVKSDCGNALALAPLAVLPAYQRQGIGKALINYDNKKAAEMGFDYSIVLGNPAVYSGCGFVNAGIYGIKPPFDVPEGCFMAVALKKNAIPLNSMIEYAKEFFEI